MTAHWNNWSSDSGGINLPPRRKPIPVISHAELMAGRNRNTGSIWDDPMVQLGGGGGTSMGGGMAYDQNRASADQWNSFSNANKQRAAAMIEGQRQGVPMSKLKEMIDRNMAMSKQGSQFTQPMGYGGSVASPSPQYTTSGNLSGADIWKDKDVLKGWGRGNIAIQQNEQGATSYPDMVQWGEGQLGDDVGWKTKKILGEEKAVRGMEGAWYDDLWKSAKDMGVKGWGELGLGAMKAYQGWQAGKMAEKQHGLAQETFDFQKAAYNKDRQGRVLAYNTNAQNVNAWKEAQGRTDLNKLMV